MPVYIPPPGFTNVKKGMPFCASKQRQVESRRRASYHREGGVGFERKEGGSREEEESRGGRGKGVCVDGWL